MLRAILFDLDGTLLDIDLDAFLSEYFRALGPTLASVAGGPDSSDAIAAVVASTTVMCGLHPDMTNREVFHSHFKSLTGMDLDSPDIDGLVSGFYRDTFPALKGDRRAKEGARMAVTAARQAGLHVVLATNPIFPRAAIEERPRWAGFNAREFDLVTSYETMSACKPHGEYFEEVAAVLGVHPSECLMVGDDPIMDLPAANKGMRTFYVGPPTEHPSDWTGSLTTLAALIDELTD